MGARRLADMEEPAAYRSYLVRICPRQVDGQRACTVTLESVASGMRVTLPDLASLVTFLNSPVDDDTGSPADGSTIAAGRS